VVSGCGGVHAWHGDGSGGLLACGKRRALPVRLSCARSRAAGARAVQLLRHCHAAATSAVAGSRELVAATPDSPTGLSSVLAAPTDSPLAANSRASSHEAGGALVSCAAQDAHAAPRPCCCRRCCASATPVTSRDMAAALVLGCLVRRTRAWFRLRPPAETLGGGKRMRRAAGRSRPSFVVHGR
jgi:hypothetical protein